MVQSRANLSPRDHEVMDTLALRVRVLSIGQIADAWFSHTTDPVGNARRRVRQLEASGLLETATMAARPPLELEAPLYRWTPDEPPPNVARLASMLAGRWTVPAVRSMVVIASRRGGIWLGGSGGRWPRQSEVSHDLTLGGLYLMLIRRDPAVKDAWCSEAALRKMGYGDHARLPDALIERAGEKVAIELGGEYGAAKLQAFHEFCVDERLPYELW